MLKWGRAYLCHKGLASCLKLYSCRKNTMWSLGAQKVLILILDSFGSRTRKKTPVLAFWLLVSSGIMCRWRENLCFCGTNWSKEETHRFHLILHFFASICAEAAHIIAFGKCPHRSYWGRGKMWKTTWEFRFMSFWIINSITTKILHGRNSQRLNF